MTRLPNLVLAGVTKAGTTSLFAYLAQHPEICPAKYKNTDYFAPLVYGDRELAALTTYKDNFGHCSGERYVLEASLSYWYGGERVIRAMTEVLEQPRVIISLRNPVQRVWSGYKMQRGKLRLERDADFDAFIATSRRLREQGLDMQERNRAYRSFSTGRYAEHLEPWFDEFGERLRIVFFEELVTQPVRVVSEVLAWLGLDVAPAGDFDYSTRNESVAHRSAVVRNVAERVNRLGWQTFRNRPQLQAGLRTLYMRVNGQAMAETMRPETRRRLEEFYLPANRRLAALLRDQGYAKLPAWLQEAESAARNQHT